MKRIMSWLLILVLLITATGCTDTNTVTSITENNDGKYITREQWIEAVGTVFGMDDYVESTPYFTDVLLDSEIFPYVQACYEWRVISTDASTFKPMGFATRGFVISSSVMILNAGDEEYTNDEILDMAVEYGFLKETDRNDEFLQSAVTREEADSLINSVQMVMLSQEAEIISEIDVVEGVEDYSDEIESIELTETDGTYIIAAEIAENLEEGEVFFAPGSTAYSKEDAVKVTSIADNGNGTYTVETMQPDLSEVFEHVKIQGKQYADYDNVIPAEGVEIIPLESPAEELSYTGSDSSGTNLNCVTTYDENGNVVKLKSNSGKSSFEMKVKLTSNGKLELSQEHEDENGKKGMGLGIDSGGNISFGLSKDLEEYGTDDVDAEINIPNPDDEDVKKLFSTMKANVPKFSSAAAQNAIADYNEGLIKKDELIKKLDLGKATSELYERKTFEKGWEISGSIKAENLAVTSNFEFGKTIWGGNNVFDPKHAKIRVTGTITDTLTLKGKLEGEYKVADVPIMFPVGSVNLQIYVYYELNGSVSVSVKVNLDNSVEWSKGSGIRKTNNTTMEKNAEVELDLEAGMTVGAALYLFGLEILSLRVKVGINAVLDASLTQEANVTVDGDELVYEEKYSVKSNFNIYLPVITLDVNKTKNNLLGKIGVSGEWKIISKDSIDDGNVGVKLTIWEIDKPICTFRVVIKRNEEEETTANSLGDYLSLDHFVVSIDEGSSMTVNVENLPAGYKESDLKWKIGDSSVATVSGGVITAKKSGSTTLTVTTSDGKYSAECSVLVN